MQVYSFDTISGNFGDDLNHLIWPAVAPALLRSNVVGTLIGIGSVLCQEFAGSVPGPKIVCGAGYAYGKPLHGCSGMRMLWVRGPLTSSKLGLDRHFSLLDGAYLVREIASASPSQRLGRIVGFMPHHESRHGVCWEQLCSSAGIRFLDPTAPTAKTLAELGECSLVVSEAMHGCIVADALGIPWVASRVFPGVNRLKWEDWTRSLKLPYRPFCGPGCNLSIHLMRHRPVRMIAASLFVKKLARQLGDLAPMRSDEVHIGPLYREMKRRLTEIESQLGTE